MLVDIITPFPNVVKAFISESILKKANQKNIVTYTIYNLFEYSDSVDGRIDDYPFGGGKGMIIKPEPVFKVLEQIKLKSQEPSSIKVLFPTPDGEQLNYNMSCEMAEYKHIVFICGHYKGIDQRIRDYLVTNEISIGDYVLTGGELPSMIILDSIVRLIPGVLNNIESANLDSFSNPLLDGPHYTRPEVFDKYETPDILLSGHHKKIEDWFLNERIKKTKKRRPDLWEKYISSNRREE